MSSQQQKVLLVQAPNTLDWVVKTQPIPTPKPGELLVKIESVALNPSDWKFPLWNLFVPSYPAVMGTDAAGTVSEIGDEVEGLVKGDKVLFQGNVFTGQGVFAQYVVVPSKIAGKIPSNITADEAATLPVSVGTAAIGLYHQRPFGYGLKPVWEEGGKGAHKGEPFVVFGGSSSVGQSVIQFARLSGFSPIIAVASTRNSEYLQSLGATHIIDRSLPPPTLVSSIKSIAAGKPIKIVFDAVSLPQTQGPAWDVLSPGGGLVIILPRDASATHLNAEEEGKVTLDEVNGSFGAPANEEFAGKLLKALPDLFEKDGFRANRLEVISNGLAGIPDGLKKIQEEKVSGYKLVVHPQKTP